MSANALKLDFHPLHPFSKTSEDRNGHPLHPFAKTSEDRNGKGDGMETIVCAEMESLRNCL